VPSLPDAGGENDYFDLYKRAKCGGSAPLLAPRAVPPQSLVAAGGYVYWAGTGAVRRVAH
jgi:hypothetical protein